MDIGQPKRIIEIEPAMVPLPGEAVPDDEPADRPDRAPEPAAPRRQGP